MCNMHKNVQSKSPKACAKRKNAHNYKDFLEIRLTFAMTRIFFYNRVCYNFNIATKQNYMEESEIVKYVYRAHERKRLAGYNV